MINRKLNKNEINLFKILTVLLLLLISNKCIIEPINIKINELKANKQNIINRKDIKENLITDSKIIDEDIVLKIQKEIKSIVNIDYIDKKIVYDENNDNEINLEIKVNGTLEQIFRMQETINKLDLSRNIKYLEINNTQNSNNVDEEIHEKMECIMQIKVG